MKKNLLFPVLIALALLNSCDRDDKITTKVVGKLANPTDNSIELLFFKNGKVEKADTIRIGKKDTVEIGSTVISGANVKSSAFNSKHFGTTTDSVVIRFNKTNKVSHYYADNPTNPYAYSYKLGNPRNVVNKNNYEATVKDNISTAIFTFKTEDASYGKEP